MISQKITNALVKHSIIVEEDYEVYLYSVQSLLGNVSNIVSTIIIGMILGDIAKAALFLGVMVPLRSTIGGCHLKNPFLCYIMSCGIVCACIVIPFHLRFMPMVVCSISVVILIIIILLIAPVDCIEKPMMDIEKKKMHSRITWVVGILVIAYFLFLWFKLTDFCLEILLALIYATCTLLIEIIRKRIRY